MSLIGFKTCWIKTPCPHVLKWRLADSKSKLIVHIQSAPRCRCSVRNVLLHAFTWNWKLRLDPTFPHFNQEDLVDVVPFCWQNISTLLAPCLDLFSRHISNCWISFGRFSNIYFRYRLKWISLRTRQTKLIPGHRTKNSNQKGTLFDTKHHRCSSVFQFQHNKLVFPDCHFTNWGWG